MMDKKKLNVMIYIKMNGIYFQIQIVIMIYIKMNGIYFQKKIECYDIYKDEWNIFPTSTYNPTPTYNPTSTYTPTVPFLGNPIFR